MTSTGRGGMAKVSNEEWALASGYGFSDERITCPSANIRRMPRRLLLRHTGTPMSVTGITCESARNISAVSDILHRLTGLVPSVTGSATPASVGGSRRGAGGAASTPPIPEARKRAYLRAAVRVLRRNTLGLQLPLNAAVAGTLDCAGREEAIARGQGTVYDGQGHGAKWRNALPPSPLAAVSVRLLLRDLNDIVDPPRKLPRFKIHLRRAPTQEVLSCHASCVRRCLCCSGDSR